MYFFFRVCISILEHTISGEIHPIQVEGPSSRQCQRSSPQYKGLFVMMLVSHSWLVNIEFDIYILDIEVSGLIWWQ